MDKFTKIALVSAISSLFAVSAHAAAYTHPTMPVPAEPFFNGFYIGAGASTVGANAEVTTTNKLAKDTLPPLSYSGAGFTITDFNNVHEGDNIKKYGFGAHVFTGFGQVIDSTFYLGGELFANYFSPNMKHSFDSELIGKYNGSSDVGSLYTTITKIKNQWSYGGDARLGYLISPKTMFYLLFGLDYSKFKVESTSTLTLPTGSRILIAFPVTNNFSKSKLGYIPGVGLETVLNDNDNFTLRAEYRHAFYSSFEKMVYGITIKEEVITDDADHSITTKVKPNRGVFSLDLSYYLK